MSRAAPRHATFRRPRRGRAAVRALAVLAAALGLGALGLSAVVALARGELEARVAGAVARTGHALTVGQTRLALTGGVELRDVRVRAAATGEEVGRLARVEVALDLLGALQGERRPREVRVVGGALRIPVTRGLVDGLRARLAGSAAGAAEGGGGAGWLPPSVILEDLDVTLLPGDGAPLAAPVTLRAASGALSRDGDARALDLRGTLDLPGGAREVTLHARTGDAPRLRVEASAPIGLEATLAGAPVTVQATALERDVAGGATRIEGLRATSGEAQVACAALVVEDVGGLVPRPEDVRTVRCDGPDARWGERRLEARRLAVTLAPTGPGALPEPRVVDLEGLRLHAASDAVEASSRRLRVDLLPGARARLDGGGALLGAVEAVTLDTPSLRLTLPEAPQLRDLLRGAAAPAPGADGRLASARDGVPLPLPGGGPLALPRGKALVEALRGIRLGVDDGHVVVDTPGQHGALRLDDLALTVRPAESGGVRAAVEALVLRAAARSGRLDVSLDVDPDGALRRASGVVAGTDIAHVLSQFSEYVTVEPDAWVQLDFDYAWEPGEGTGEAAARHRVRGELRFEDFGFQAWRISHAPVTGLEGRVRYDAAWTPARHHLELDLPEMTLGEAHVDGHLALTVRPGDGPVIAARVTMPEQDCGAVARAIPPALVSRLEGLQLRGRMAFSASLDVDMDAPYGLELAVDGDVERCSVVTLGKHIDLMALADGPYVHHPVEPERGVLEHVTVGPGTSSWVPSEHLPLFVKAAAVVTEDRGFWWHQGVRWELIARALKLNLDKKRFVYGGSTITQQLVKNLYLTREKTLSRKLEELIIAWQMERTLTKDRILTLYVNMIEYGPDLYGVRRASHHYFAKEPSQLSPAEAAFIMGLKPFPKAGYRQWERQTLNKWWVARVQHVMEMMVRREKAISEVELLAAAPYQVTFRRPDEPLWSSKRYVPPVAPPARPAPGAHAEGAGDGTELDGRVPPP